LSEIWKDAFGDLLDLEQWVGWDLRDGRKIPINPWSRQADAASSTDRMTWGPYRRAKGAAEAMGLSGVGFVFTADDPYVGIDLDDCRDPDSGAVDRWALEVVDRVDSYTEISPSGTGLKIWCRGDMERHALKDNEQGLEVYQQGRYFALTGQHFEPSPVSIERATGALSWLTDTYFPPRTPDAEGRASTRSLVDEWHQSQTSDLDPGQWAPDALEAIDPDCGYDDWLAVGQALHEGYNGSNRGLELWDQWSRRGSKYEENRPGELQDKWQSFGRYQGTRRTLGTVWQMAESAGWTFQPTGPDVEPFDGLKKGDGSQSTGSDADRREASSDTGDTGGGGEGEDSGIQRLEWLDAAELYEDRSDYEPHLVEPGVIGTSDIAMIFGPPKSMKTMATMGMCRNWAAGRAWMDLEPQRPLRIAYLNFEIKEDNLRRRLHLADLEDDHVEQMRGNWWLTNRFVDTLSPQFVSDCVQSLTEGPPGGGSFDLVVVDPLIDLFNGDSENDNKQVKEFIKHLRILAHRIDPDCALLLVHHSNKTGREDRHAEPFASLRGGSAFRGSYDTGISLAWETERREALRMSFEVRNGPGLDNRYVSFDEEAGRFVHKGDLNGSDASERVAGESTGEQWDREHARKAITICQLIRQEAEAGTVHTQSSFSEKFASTEHGLGSQRTIHRKISEMATKGVIGFFEAGEYGGPPPHHRSDGHLCCKGMVVGQVEEHGRPQLVSVDEAAGVVEDVQPNKVRAEGYPEPVDVERIEEFDGLQAAEAAYSAKF